MKKTRIYVEGGGDTNFTVTKCRKGFSKFFEKIVPAGMRPKIIACGGRQNTYENFVLAHSKYIGENVILLVDSEGPVTEKSVWEHLKKHDNWDSVGLADSAQLMVQSMESWFLADKDSLQQFYGQGFSLNSLPARENIDEISKDDVKKGLDDASRNTLKGKYHKTRHGFNILASIDPTKLNDIKVSKHARRLFFHLRQLTTEL